MTDKEAGSVVTLFKRAFGEILARVDLFERRQASGPPALSGAMPTTPGFSVAIAYSGGLDSSALLHLACDYASVHRFPLYAFHIHHGISPHADQWLAHCERESARLGIRFDARHVNVSAKDKGGIEQAARIARYAALGELCRAHGVPLLLAAHHQDDQAETVLMHLLRGSGAAGLSGMELANKAPDLLGDPALIIGRPLLSVPRAALADFTASKNIQHVEDESNTDTRYARNALRHQVMPALIENFPGFQHRVARSAAHARSAQRLLVDLAAQDLAACAQGECLDIKLLKRLSIDRIDNLLRYWFSLRGVRMPSTAWMNEMRTQLTDAKADARLCVTHADCVIRRHRDRVFITPKIGLVESAGQAQTFRWDGSARMRFAAFGGSLHFDPTPQGIAAGWLREALLSIRFRSGGERLKLAGNRPTRSLKAHYQTLDIPSWERERLPIVSASNRLLFAAGIGIDCQFLSDAKETRIGLRWEPDRA